MALSRINILPTRKTIYFHYLKSISPSILTKSTLLFPFSPLLLLLSAVEVGFLIPQEWEHSVGRQSCAYLCAALVVAGYFSVREFCPCKSFPLISESQVLVFSDTRSLRSRSFRAGKWANTFQVATTASALLGTGKC